ncbi:MAG TPA: RidA family protein [Anaerolineae bacterium]|nr:RidA family protein [Anaerolineae bacterium]
MGEPRRVSAAITYPAMTLVEVKSLFDDAALIEIEGIVVIGEMK